MPINFSKYWYSFSNLRITIFSFFLFSFFGTGNCQIPSCNYSIKIQVINTLDTSLNTGIEIFLEKSHALKYTNRNGEVSFDHLCDSINEFDIVLPDTHFHVLLNSSNKTIQKIKIHSNFGGDFSKFNTLEIHGNQNKLICIIPPLPLLYLNLNSPYKINDYSLSLANLLAKLPMIQTTQSGGTIAKPLIQGMSGIRAPLFWNGIRIEGQNWGGDHAPEIALFGDEMVELNKGSESLKFGSDLWGNMVNFKQKFSRENNQVNFSEQSEYFSNGNGIKTAGIITIGHAAKSRIYSSYLKYSAMMAGNYKVPDGILSNTAMNEISMAGGHATKKSEIHYSFYQSELGIYTGSHIGNLTDLNAAIHSSIPLYTSNSMNYNIDLPKQLARQLSVVFSNHSIKQLLIELSYQNNLRQEFAYSRIGRSDIPQININASSINGKAIYYWQLPRIEIGTENQYLKQVYATNYLVPEYNGIKSDLFIAKNWQQKTYNTQLKQEVIARFDAITRSGMEYNDKPFIQNSQGFSGGYSIWHTSKINLKEQTWQVHLLQLWRAPAPNELYSFGVHHGSAAFEQGNPELKPETGQKIDANYMWSQNATFSKLDFSLAGFFQNSPNFILLIPQKDPILTVKGAFPAFKYSQMATIFSGIEYFLRYVHLRANLSQQIRIENKFNLTYGKYSNGNYPTGIPSANTTLNIQSEIKHNLFFSFSILHQFKQNWYTQGSDFLPPPEAATIFKTDIHTIINHQWEIGLFIDNLTNLKYRNYTDKFRYFVDMPGRNIGIKILYQIHHHKNHTD